MFNRLHNLVKITFTRQISLRLYRLNGKNKNNYCLSHIRIFFKQFGNNR